jgi:predicted RNase H-like HicB family nuclease
LFQAGNNKSMKEIFFIVEEDNESGGYIARAIGKSIFTDGETIKELKTNIKEVLECHFENEENRPQIAHLHFVKDEILSLV